MKKTEYRMPASETLTEGALARFIKIHLMQAQHYKKLESYCGDEPIMRRREPSKILAYHNYAEYIIKINSGYLMGKPVEYASSEDVDISQLTEAYVNQDIADLDAELAEDCSTFGRAFEVMYQDEDSNTVSERLEASSTFVIYDNTYRRTKLYAVNYVAKIVDGKPKEGVYTATVWSAGAVAELELKLKDIKSTVEIQFDTDHPYGEVPVVEYMNNRKGKADHEPVITLIDAYNILQSDRITDREKLVDAILAFYGVTLSNEDKQRIKEGRVVTLPEGAKGEYIIKNINEADSEVLRATIASDIHKFSMTPDLSDKEFTGNSSGVAILYKLLAFEQNIKRKSRYFQKGLQSRLRIYLNILKVRSKVSDVKIGDVSIIFKRDLPKNDLEISQIINNLLGTIDKRLLASQLSFVRDADKTVERAESEEEEGTPYVKTDIKDKNEE